MEALDYKFMKERLIRMQEQVEAFKVIAAEVTSNHSDERVLKTICSQISQLMRAERTTLFLVKTRDGETVLETTIAQNVKSPITLKLGQGIAGHVALTREALNCKDAYLDPHFDPSFDEKNGFKTTSCIASPIFIRNELIGVVQVLNRYRGYFTLEDAELLESICSQIGVSISQYKSYLDLTYKNAELIDARTRLEQKNRELEQRNDEQTMLFELERDAAQSLDLNDFVSRMLPRCLKTFHSHYAAVVMCEPVETRLFEMTRPDANSSAISCSSLVERCESHKLGLVKQVLGAAVPVMLRPGDDEKLQRLVQTELGVELGAIMAVALKNGDQNCGIFVLGRDLECAEDYSPNDGRLFTLIATSLSVLITMRQKREADQREKALTIIGQMMSSLLHDMKTPLANISGYTELLAFPDIAPEKRDQAVETVERNIDRIKVMIAEILQFARGDSALLLRNTTFEKMFRGSLEMLQNEAEKRHITLRCVEHYSQNICCDELKIQRVIENLVKNAMEAIGHDGTVTLSTYGDDKHVYLRIEDDGPGIPAQIRENLFEAFVTHGKVDGTGLGLAFVKKTVDEHQAQITCVPVEPHGTAFIIAFNA